METISISKFKATCLALLERVRQTGEPIIVTKRGVPIAQVVPPPSAEKPPVLFGAMGGALGRHIGALVPADQARHA